MSSAESEAFRKCSAELIQGIQDTDQLAWELYSDNVVSKFVVERVNAESFPADKKTKLFSAVGDQINVNPPKFQILLHALRKRSQLKVVIDKLETTYRECGMYREGA